MTVCAQDGLQLGAPAHMV